MHCHWQWHHRCAGQQDSWRDLTGCSTQIWQHHCYLQHALTTAATLAPTGSDPVAILRAPATGQNCQPGASSLDIRSERQARLGLQGCLDLEAGRSAQLWSCESSRAVVPAAAMTNDHDSSLQRALASHACYRCMICLNKGYAIGL